MRALLTATVILLVAVPVVALAKEQRATGSASPNLQVNVGTTGWTFDVLKMQHRPGWSTVKHDPYGVFTSRDECEIARTKVVFDLDDRNLRQFRPLPKEPDNGSTYTGTGNTSMTGTSQGQSGYQSTYTSTSNSTYSSDTSGTSTSNSTYSSNTSEANQHIPPLSDTPFEFMNATACHQETFSAAVAQK